MTKGSSSTTRFTTAIAVVVSLGAVAAFLARSNPVPLSKSDSELLPRDESPAMERRPGSTSASARKLPRPTPRDKRHEFNSARSAGLEGNVEALQQASPQVPLLHEARIPPGASETMKDFLRERTRLQNDRARIQNQMRESTPEERQQALQTWHEQNSTALEAQQDRARQMSEEEPVGHHTFPAAANIPPNATPELRTFLTERHALMKEQAEMTDRLRTASPDERQQALEDWHRDNSERLQAMQEAAVQLSNQQNTSSNPRPRP